MNKTSIEWCTRTWNPVTGCRHGCEYCFARRIAERFAAPAYKTHRDVFADSFTCTLHCKYKSDDGRVQPYPNGFLPTFHRYRLGEPAAEKRPQNVFTVDMGDLFGQWIPEDWFLDIFVACLDAPQHNYLFLTKNPGKYLELVKTGMLPAVGYPNWWFGATVNSSPDLLVSGQGGILAKLEGCNRFLSIEPLHGALCSSALAALRDFHWVIVGAETGPGAAANKPERLWVETIVGRCRAVGVPVFLKNSLAEIWGEPLIREYPEGLRAVAERGIVR